MTRNNDYTQDIRFTVTKRTSKCRYADATHILLTIVDFHLVFSCPGVHNSCPIQYPLEQHPGHIPDSSSNQSEKKGFNGVTCLGDPTEAALRPSAIDSNPSNASSNRTSVNEQTFSSGSTQRLPEEPIAAASNTSGLQFIKRNVNQRPSPLTKTPCEQQSQASETVGAHTVGSKTSVSYNLPQFPDSRQPHPPGPPSLALSPTSAAKMCVACSIIVLVPTFRVRG